MNGVTGAEELVVLLDESGHAAGTAPKRTVHHLRTPLHLAFSCYIFDADGALLLTQRALHKPTWPGVWTNSVCGHPAPGERLADAVARRARDELGVSITDLQLALPAFRYEAVMANGVRENEMCPVFVATSTDRVEASADEVAAFEWVGWHSLCHGLASGRREISPWAADQVRLLDERARELGRMGDGDRELLPPAATQHDA